MSIPLCLLSSLLSRARFHYSFPPSLSLSLESPRLCSLLRIASRCLLCLFFVFLLFVRFMLRSRFRSHAHSSLLLAVGAWPPSLTLLPLLESPPHPSPCWLLLLLLASFFCPFRWRQAPTRRMPTLSHILIARASLSLCRSRLLLLAPAMIRALLCCPFPPPVILACSSNKHHLSAL